MTTVADTLAVGRSNLIERVRGARNFRIRGNPIAPVFRMLPPFRLPTMLALALLRSIRSRALRPSWRAPGDCRTAALGGHVARLRGPARRGS